MAIFKAYDIRGIVGKELTTQVALRIGRGFSQFIRKESGQEAPLVVIGTRRP